MISMMCSALCCTNNVSLCVLVFCGSQPGVPHMLTSAYHLHNRIKRNTFIITVVERRDNWHTSHGIFFHNFSVLVQLNVTARVGSNTLGLQSDLHKFGAIHKEKEEKAFSLTSALV